MSDSLLIHSIKVLGGNLVSLLNKYFSTCKSGLYVHTNTFLSLSLSSVTFSDIIQVLNIKSNKIEIIKFIL